MNLVERPQTNFCLAKQYARAREGNSGDPAPNSATPLRARARGWPDHRMGRRWRAGPLEREIMAWGIPRRRRSSQRSDNEGSCSAFTISDPALGVFSAHYARACVRAVRKSWRTMANEPWPRGPLRARARALRTIRPPSSHPLGRARARNAKQSPLWAGASSPTELRPGGPHTASTATLRGPGRASPRPGNTIADKYRSARAGKADRPETCA